MHIPNDGESPRIESVDELVADFVSACKPRDRWRIGAELELVGVREDDSPVPYSGEAGVSAVLARMSEQQGWEPVREGAHIIGLARDGGSVTIEPGGQLEYAGPPVDHASEIDADLGLFVNAVTQASAGLDVRWLGVGFRPTGGLDDIEWVPKQRYVVMRDYLPTRGAFAHDMMKRTGTVQVSLDFSDRDDAARKFRAIHSLAPLLTSLYAGSPIVDGRATDYQSYRARTWLDTDPDRCGVLELAFADGDVFRAYVEWALDVPLFFVHRGTYLPAPGYTFRRFLREGFQGYYARIADWQLHLSTLFPEARFKQYIEVRCCDAGAREMVLALAPLCRGLLYDRTACDAAIALTASLSFAERVALAAEVPRAGLSARVGARSLLDLVRELIDIARDGLSRVQPDEQGYLEPLAAIARTGVTRADHIRAAWRRDPAEAMSLLAWI